MPSSPCHSDEHPVPPRHPQPVRGNALKTMSSRPRYFLIGGIALVATAGLIGWLFLDQRGEVLKPDGGPVVTVMDFGRSFPLDPLPSGWRRRKFWTRSPISMAFAVKDGVPSIRVDAVPSGRCRSRRPPDACLALVDRIANPQPARRTHARRRRSSRAPVPSVPDRPW